MDKKNNVMFIKVGDLRVRVSSILSYQLVEYKHVTDPALRFVLKVVTSRSSFIIKVNGREEGEAIMEDLDNVLVLNK